MFYSLDRYYGGNVGAALLLLRLIAGGAFILHGLPKVADVAGFAGRIGVPTWLGAVAAYTEVIGGGLLILGLLMPIAAAFLAIEMVVALFMVHIPAGHPFVAATGPSWELAALYLVMMLAFLLTGPGAYSLDAQIARQRATAGGEASPTERRRGIV